MGRADRTGVLVVVLGLALTGCLAGAGGPSPTDPNDLQPTTTLPPATTTTTLSVEEGVEAYRSCLSEEGVTLGPVRLDTMGRPRMAEAMARLDLGDRSVIDALETCGHIIASGPLDLTSDPELAVRVREQLADFAECIRLEGVAGYPDPVSDFDGVGSPFPVNRIPWSDPDLVSAVETCRAVLGG